RYNTPIISLVINNNKFGTIRAHQEGKFPDRVIGTDLTNPDFAELAKNFGGYGIKVNNNEDFSKALREALENDKPTLIEVAINPEILSANQEK
ncbi:MAG TPA: thiamine pyrophosphate-dependent enzyme, partial [Pseudogracilibacillus sp.]|nr:thiamine pyrophosphate-dependent enzyme [Pseudogracilibacillus sp.]